MIYAVVFIGSLIGIAAMIVLRLLVRQRSVRRFVRSVRQRFTSAQQRGATLVQETPVARPKKNPRTSAIELQQVRSILRTVEKAWKQEHFEEVERLLIQALTILPEDYDVRAQLARLYLTTERENKAEAMYRELLQTRSDVSFFANLGLAYYRQGKYTDACHAYQEALNHDPKNPDRCVALGRACIAAQRFADAAPLLEKAATYLTRDTAILHLLAECYVQLNQYDKAEETYRRINRLEPYNEDVKSKMRTVAKQAADQQSAG